jgi:DNA-binding beta-propeller fold protein YncE
MRTFLSTTLITFATALPLLAQESTTRDLHGALDFQGRYLVSVQDADMVASAYVNGQLGPREGVDTLAVIALEGDPRDWVAAEVPASNSVAGPPAAVDISPDGKHAIVIETWTPRPDDGAAHTFSDLAFGTKITVVDLSTPSTPVVSQIVEGPLRPDSVRFNSTGDLVAISFNPAGAGTETPLVLYPFEGGELGAGTAVDIPDWPAGSRLIDMAWHPSENTLALLDGSGGAQMIFARVDTDLTLERFGNTVDLERAPYRVFFTPDGRHVVVNGLYWGPDIAGFWIEGPVGSVSTIRMNAETRDDGTVRHAFVDRITTGVSPEGLAVSPDGQWVATTNLERSYLPYEDERITWWSSITLARLDPETGQMALVGTFNYDGILPEAAVFDNSSQYLAVANYDHFDDRIAGSSIDFWRIQSDPLNVENTQLIKTTHTVPVARGAHSMVIAR